MIVFKFCCVCVCWHEWVFWRSWICSFRIATSENFWGLVFSILSLSAAMSWERKIYLLIVALWSLVSEVMFSELLILLKPSQMCIVKYSLSKTKSQGEIFSKPSQAELREFRIMSQAESVFIRALTRLCLRAVSHKKLYLNVWSVAF